MNAIETVLVIFAFISITVFAILNIVLCVMDLKDIGKERNGSK